MEAFDGETLVSGLMELELAILLCLTAQEHCVIETTSECVDDVCSELALVNLPSGPIKLSA
jgi:hypothetical protein